MPPRSIVVIDAMLYGALKCKHGHQIHFYIHRVPHVGTIYSPVGCNLAVLSEQHNHNFHRNHSKDESLSLIACRVLGSNHKTFCRIDLEGGFDPISVEIPA